MFATFSISDLFSGTLNPIRVVLTLLIAFAVGGFLHIIYKKSFAGVVYSRSFNISLILLTMVSALVLMLISSNLTLSLGMVGALSIVRFRTAVKDPLDTIFMFWSIAAGIMLGAKLYVPALIASAVIGILLVVLSLIKAKKNMPYILVLRFDENAKKEVQALLGKFPQGKLKSKTVSRGVIELTIEMNVDAEDINMMDRFGAIHGVYDASLISYKGDVVS